MKHRSLRERSFKVLPGQYFDKETNLHYNYFRDYDPAIGRYIQSDPVGLQGGINTYAYVANNPLGWIDTDGRQIVGSNREGRTERSGRERPSETRPSTPSSESPSVLAANKQFCHALCVQRKNESRLKPTALACAAGIGIFTAAEGPVGFAGSVGASAGLLIGTVIGIEQECQAECF
jgi:RHS repeat-associated protein